MTGKLSISLSDDDLRFVDDAVRQSATNRSAVIHDFIRIAREMKAVDDYRAAYGDAAERGFAGAWDSTSGDGLA